MQERASKYIQLPPLGALADSEGLQGVSIDNNPTVIKRRKAHRESSESLSCSLTAKQFPFHENMTVVGGTLLLKLGYSKIKQ